MTQPRLALFHTADIHVATFDRLLSVQGFNGPVQHVVRPDLLDLARTQGLAAASETETILSELAAAADAVLCSCSTLGPIADRVTARHPQILRFDRPLMQAALTHGSTPLVAYCLESTAGPTLDLLEQTAKALSMRCQPRALLCASAWPHFERGDMAQFGAEIASSIRRAVDQDGQPDCILLAQASMAAAAPLLRDIGCPTLTAPEIATRALLERVGAA